MAILQSCPIRVILPVEIYSVSSVTPFMQLNSLYLLATILSDWILLFSNFIFIDIFKENVWGDMDNIVLVNI